MRSGKLETMHVSIIKAQTKKCYFSQVSLSGKLLKPSSSLNIGDFMLLKKFKINVRPPAPQRLKEVLWIHLFLGWIKGNINDASIRTPNTIAYGGIFRDHYANHLGNFSSFLGSDNSLFVELVGAILAMEHALSFDWFHFWLETNSMLVVRAISKPTLVIWKIRKI